MGPGSVLLSHGEAPHYHRRWYVSLLGSEWSQVVPYRYGRQTKTVVTTERLIVMPLLSRQDATYLGKGYQLVLNDSKHLGCCMVKSHGQLVRVSSTHYYASTSRLSTLSSSTTLQST